jgi:membrane-associated phospholipid phosphatase/predicted MFS family arabinose efflux permease
MSSMTVTLPSSRRRALLSGRPRLPFLLAFAAAAVGAGIGRAVTTSYLPVLLERIDDNPGLIGMVMLVNAIAGFAVPLVVGVWSDRRGDRGRGRRMPFVIGGAVVAAGGLAAVTIGHGTSYVVLALAGTAVYVGLNSITTAHRALIPEIFAADRRAKVTSAQELGLLAGGMVGLAVGGLLTTVAVWAPFALAAVLVPLLALPTLRRTREQPNVPAPAADKTNRAFAYYWDAARRPGVRAFLVAQILWVLGYAALPAFFLLYAEAELGLTAATASLMLVGFGAMTAAAIALAGRARRSERHKPLLAAAVTLMGVGFLVVASSTSLLVVGAGLVAAATGFGLISVIGFPLFSTLIPEGESGGYTALYFSVRSIASAVALPAAGGLIALSGSYRALFVLGGLATLAALLPLLGVRASRRGARVPRPVRWLGAVAAVYAVTFALAGLLEHTALQQLDEWVFQLVNGFGPGHQLLWDILDPHMRNYLILLGVAVVAAAVTAPRRIPRVTLLVAGSAAFSYAFLNGVNRVYDRARPEETLDPSQINAGSHWAHLPSYPSGHMAVTAALAVAIAFAFPRLRHALWAYVVLVAVTRVLFGAHFPFDVMMGTFVGYASARLVASSLRRPSDADDVADPPSGEPLPRDEVVALMPSYGTPPSVALIAETQRHVGRLVIVDDGSEPADAQLLRSRAVAAGADLLRLPENVGKGSAVRAGLDRILDEEGPSTTVLLIDADGQHPPESIPLFLEAAGAGAELVIGDRFGELRSMPIQRRAMNKAASGILGLTTGRKVRDSQSGMRLLRGRALVDTPFPGGRYEAETLHLKASLVAGVRVEWVPIPAIYDGERSSFRAAADTFRVLAALLARPTTARPTAMPSVAPASTSIR